MPQVAYLTADCLIQPRDGETSDKEKEGREGKSVLMRRRQVGGASLRRFVRLSPCLCFLCLASAVALLRSAPLRSLPWCVLWWRFVALPSMPPCPYYATLRDGTNNVTPSAEGGPPFLTALNALRAADTEGDKSYRRGYACGYRKGLILIS